MWLNLLTRLTILSSFFLGPVYANQQLTATIIGSGSPTYNEERAGPSVLISAGETHILVDMGNGTQANLQKLAVNVRNVTALLFTHHHLDHNEEFVPILIGALMGNRDVTIVGPPNTKKLTEVNLDLYQEDISYRLAKSNRTLVDREQALEIIDIKGGESFQLGGIRISTIEVPHTIHTIAYRFDYNDQSIVVTGDLTYSEGLPTLAKDADFMIIDSGGMVMSNARLGAKTTSANQQRSGTANNQLKERAHLNLIDSSLLAKQSNVSNLVYTHFNTGIVDTEASLKVIEQNYRGNVIFAQDLMVLSATDIKSAASLDRIANAFPVVDTGQKKLYSSNDTLLVIKEGDAFFGQDANYIINDPSYTDNNDGTVTDNITGLMWQKELDEKLTYLQALEAAESYKLAGYDDWRLPSIKELYSLIQFNGTVMGERALTPFIDTSYFEQPLGDTSKGEREIDAQLWSSTEYVGKTMNSDETVFGVNFVDGRIKGYPKYNPRTREPNEMYFRLVRGNEAYGENNFVDNGDGTITDFATGLMWQKSDSREGLIWRDALHYSESLQLGGYDDWRLPNAKELQSIVDYSRSPNTSNTAALDSIFDISTLINEAGEQDYPYYWSSTTHLDGPVPENNAVYIAFGNALGEMQGRIMDVHGAGAQRSDPKTGEPMSKGPQGDMIRVTNYVRSVRGGVIDMSTSSSNETERVYSQAPSGNSRSPANIKPPSTLTNMGSRFINRLDKNGDGKVSMSEFGKTEPQFKRLDKNNDGFITSNEAPTGPLQ